MEICEIPGLPLAMVLCSHQSNVYIKRKLRVWSDQKWIPFLGAKTSCTCAGLETTPSQVSQYRAENGNLRNSGSTFSQGTVFAPKQCVYQKEDLGMESPKLYSYSRCKNLTYLCGTANDPVSSEPVLGLERKFAESGSSFIHGNVFEPKQCCQVSQYKAENGNLWNSGCTFSHGTVFASKQYLYQN